MIIVSAVPVVYPLYIPEIICTSSASCLWVEILPVALRLSMSDLICSISTLKPAGRPSNVIPMAGPWLSPNNVQDIFVPKLFFIRSSF